LSISSPVITDSVGIPSSLPIATAVALWSPVIMTTFMPASLHFFIASMTSFLGGSIIPMSPMKTKPDSMFFSFFFDNCLYAKPSTLSAVFAISRFFFDMVSRSLAVILRTLPLMYILLHLWTIISGAPFVNA